MFTTKNVEETLAMGRKLGEFLEPGDVVALIGELGSGKTTLAKGIARGLGVDGVVLSPSFNIILEYTGRVPFYHIDFYRLGSLEEVLGLGLEEYLYGKGVSAVEWADRFPSALLEERLDVELSIAGEDQRNLNFKARGKRFKALLKKI